MIHSCSPVARRTMRGIGYARGLLAVALLALAGGGAFLVRWYTRTHDLRWATQRGLDRLAAARSPAEQRRATLEWEKEAAGTLQSRAEDWISYVVSHYSLADERVRRLLAHVAGADYGDRAKDWQRWSEARQRLAKGQQPVVPPKERVELSERWRAAVGLTSFFSTILPIDGQIYVSSLGEAFEGASDQHDGVVRVDGRTGEALLIFEPPEKGSRDVLGLAYADGTLFAAGRNGFVYALEPDGRVRWKANAGARLASIPLLVDVNRDGLADVIVVTANGHACAFSNGGKPLWSVPIELAGRAAADAAGQSAEQNAIRASFALGHVPGATSQVVFITTAGGDLYALAPTTGKTLWRQSIDAPIVAAPVCVPASDEHDSLFEATDQRGRVWSLTRGAKGPELAAVWSAEDANSARVVASLRTLGHSSAAPLAVACTAGDPAGRGGSIQVFGPGGLQWRCTPGGALWAAPAIADVNGDGRAELIVVSSSVSGSDWWSWLSIVSAEGHLLRRVWFDAAVECAPAVADVDGDGWLEILVADRTGLLHCIETKKSGPVEWGLPAGDPRNSRNAGDACAFGQMPVGHQAKWRPR